MIRTSKTAIVLATLVSAVLVGLLAGSVAAAPTDPPYPSRIDLPAPTFDPVTGAVISNFSPEGIAVSGNTFYASNTATGEIIKGNLMTGAYTRNFVPASPNQPSDLHRGGPGALGLLVDDHNRLWAAGTYGMVCTSATSNPPCPAGVTGPVRGYGAAFVYDATSGALLAQYTLSQGGISPPSVSRTINDVTISNNVAYFANTSSPAGQEIQYALPLGPGGALPPSGPTPPAEPAVGAVSPGVFTISTPGFVSSDGIDTLINGHVLFASVSGNNGNMIQVDPTTLAVTPIVITPEAGRPTGNPAGSLPPSLSVDGVTLDGKTLYFPENRTDVATCPASPVLVPPVSPNNNTLPCPGDIGVMQLSADGTTGQIVARLNSPAGSGLPPLRSPANMEELGHYVYVISRVVVPTPNPVLPGVTSNLTYTFIERLDKLAITATGSAVSATEGASHSGPVATFTDPNTGETAAAYTASINWGDGTTSAGVVTGTSGVVNGTSAGTFSVGGTHTYAEEGTYTVTATISDAATAATLGTTTSTATVADAALTAGLIKASCGSGPCSVTFGFTDANPNGSVADFTAAIHWGDGATTVGVVTAGGGGFVVSGSHTYADDGGGHVISITVTDDGGSTASASTPAATGMLVGKGSNGSATCPAPCTAEFTVVATCSSGTATAWLNGIPVVNGQVVRLKMGKKEREKWEGKTLALTDDSFQLVVNCTDAAGNVGSSATAAAFRDDPPGKKNH